MIADKLQSHSELPSSARDQEMFTNLLKFRNFYTRRNFDIVKLFATGRELEFKKRFSTNLKISGSPEPEKVLMEGLSRRQPYKRPISYRCQSPKKAKPSYTIDRHRVEVQERKQTVHAKR
jgi:hypothetical protein